MRREKRDKGKEFRLKGGEGEKRGKWREKGEGIEAEGRGERKGKELRPKGGEGSHNSAARVPRWGAARHSLRFGHSEKSPQPRFKIL